MRRLGLLLLVLVMANGWEPTVGLAQAQTPAAAAPAAPVVPGNKIVTVDFRKALGESAPGKAAMAKHDKETAPELAKIEKLAGELRELQTKLQNAKTDAERNTITNEIQGKQKEGQRIQEDAQLLSERLQQSLLPPIAAMVSKAVADWGKANNVALVIDATTEPSNVVFADSATEITAEVMRAVNAAYEKDPKLADPAAAPAGAAPAPAR